MNTSITIIGYKIPQSSTDQTLDDMWLKFNDCIDSLPKGYMFADDRTEDFYIGFGQKNKSDLGIMIPIKSYDEIKSEIERILEPFVKVNLFPLNDKLFGIWILNNAF